VHVAVTVPLQAPPQTVASVVHAARGAIGGPLTGLQMPTLPETLHASHCPLHALSQHTPSLQKPLAQWPATVHCVPFVAVGMHVWPLQYFPLGHWASLLQVTQPGIVMMFWQPERAQVSAVQLFASSQRASFGVPAQTPLEHLSFWVQAAGSVQLFVLFVYTQPAALAPALAGLQTSFVQTLRSSQAALTGVPTQLPPEHESVVQALPSLQVSALFGVFVQPPPVQASSVHGLPSLHFESLSV
jgi:hypothetical protein